MGAGADATSAAAASAAAMADPSRVGDAPPVDPVPRSNRMVETAPFARDLSAEPPSAIAAELRRGEAAGEGRGRAD